MSEVTHKSAQWIYSGIWKVLVDLFRVPKQPPDLPVREGEYIARFQPGEGFLRYLKFLFWIFLVVSDFAFTAAYIGIAIACVATGLWWLALLLLPIALFMIIAPDIIAYIAIHLRYDTTWYVMTDRSLRIRRGIWVIHETTITFENVQNVKMQQGPVQRYFGIASLIVETAGGGSGHSHGKGGQSSMGHMGIIEGVSNAEELRDRILLRLRASKTAGLGDEDHHHDAHVPAAQATFTAAHRAALREIREELRLMNANPPPLAA